MATLQLEALQRDGETVTLGVPVVFLVLPVTVLFALFPGFYSLSLVAG